MTNTQHTHGPWKLGKAATETAIYGASGEHIATLPDMLTKEEIRQNARLIAAAPELLAALEMLMEQGTEREFECGIGVYPEFTPACDVARAAIAIAKARGED